jgi:hypothetical protein
VLRRLAISVFALVVAGVVFEQVGRRVDRRRYPQIGRSVDIGGRTMNIYCSGEGGPTVVFETFSHMAGYSWSGVQREVAKVTRACWYDRAGYGWSEPGPMLPTYRAAVSDLHALLKAAGESPPYVFAGAGDAALQIRVFHGVYPTEVAGVVMVEPNPVDVEDVPEKEKGPWARHFGIVAPRMRGAACMAFPALASMGTMRFGALFQHPRHTPAIGVAAEERAMLDYLSDNPTAALGASACTREESMKEVRAAGGLGDVPVVVLDSYHGDITVAAVVKSIRGIPTEAAVRSRPCAARGPRDGGGARSGSPRRGSVDTEARRGLPPP